jgi:hypothetical protein
VEQGKRICEVLFETSVRVMSPEYWMYECRDICWEWFLKFWWSVLCSLLFCFIGSVNKNCYLLNPGLSVTV